MIIPLVDGLYYAGENGALLSGVWRDYGSVTLGGADDLESSLTGKNYSEYKELWLYFDDNFKN